MIKGLRFTKFKGGPGDPGSGHHGHAGRPGYVGGSVASYSSVGNLADAKAFVKDSSFKEPLYRGISSSAAEKANENGLGTSRAAHAGLSGVFLTPDRDFAQDYARDYKKGGVVTAYANVKNVYHIKGNDFSAVVDDLGGPAKASALISKHGGLANYLQSKGHDAAWIPSPEPGKMEFIVFNPANVMLILGSWEGR